MTTENGKWIEVEVAKVAWDTLKKEYEDYCGRRCSGNPIEAQFYAAFVEGMDHVCRRLGILEKMGGEE